MMKVAVFLALFALTVTAQARVEPGTYKGHKADQSECSLVAGATFYERGTPHPLNERITITLGADTFVVGHPAVIDAEDSFIYFNHDLFLGLLPTATGAKLLEIQMEHSERYEGPVGFTFIENNWKTKERSSYKCFDLRLVK